jgi:hypothetical protein
LVELTKLQNVIEFGYIKWCIITIIHGAYAGQEGYVARVLDSGSLSGKSSRNGLSEGGQAASGVLESVGSSRDCVVMFWLTKAGLKLAAEKLF